MENILFIVGGGVAIALGGDVVVESSRNIAVACGMSETLVGLTIVYIGTSHPELVTSFVAAKKNEVDMAHGMDQETSRQGERSDYGSSVCGICGIHYYA